MCAGASYTILVAFDNGKSTYYYVSEEDAEQSSYFESFFQNRYLPLLKRYRKCRWQYGNTCAGQARKRGKNA